MGGLSIFILLSILMSMFFIFFIVVMAITIYILINYIFESIFLHTILKRKNYKYSSFSFIPFYNKCILGKVSEKRKLGISLGIIDAITVILIIISYTIKIFPSTINTIIFFIIILLLILSFIFNLILTHSIIKKVYPKLTDILTIINVFTLGFFRSIILFFIRNNQNLK